MTDTKTWNLYLKELVGIHFSKKSIKNHFWNNIFIYIVFGIYLIDYSQYFINMILYFMARIYTVNKYKRYCTANQQKNAIWGNLLILIISHVTFTESFRFILDSSQFSLKSLLISYFTHLVLAVFILEIEIKSRLFKELNVVSKFRKSLKFQEKFGNKFLNPFNFDLSKWPDLLFFIYIYNNTSNCILWYTEIMTRNKWHIKDFFRYSLFKILMVYILNFYIQYRIFVDDIIQLKYFFIAICTYLFSLVEVEFMKEDLILEKNLVFNESIIKSINRIKLKEKVRSSIKSFSNILKRSKSFDDRNSKSDGDLVDKSFYRSKSIEKKLKKE